jgi:hypothetical protein
MPRAVALALFVLLAGCASTTPTAEGMIPAFTVRGVRGPVHSEALAVDARGDARIPGPALRQALADAVTMSRVFSRVAPSGSYVLTVAVSRVEVPESRLNINLNPTVRMEAAWTLRRAGARAPLWQATVRSQSTTEPTDTLDGKARLRMAIEGAARENIALGLARIAKLRLGAPERARADADDAAPAGTAGVAIAPYADPRVADGPVEQTHLDPDR